jgi:hypothetical protein
MEEKLFGIKALEICFHAFLFGHGKTGITKDDWRDKNLQPKRTAERKSWSRYKHDWCPHYDLIELCAGIMGIEPSELNEFNYFCGFLVKDIGLPGPMRLLPRRGGGELIPFCCCQAIRDILNLSIEFAKSKKPRPIKKISDSLSEKERKKLQKFLITDQKFNQGQQILKLWKKTIPRNIGTEKRRYSEDDLILEAENLLEQLQKQAAGNLYSFGSFCEVAPRHEFSRLFPID